MAGLNLNTEAIRTLNGVTISRNRATDPNAPSPDSLVRLSIAGDVMNLRHVHGISDPSDPVGIRQVLLAINFRTGIAAGTEELIGRKVEKIDIHDVHLPSEGAAIRLPISNAKIEDYLRSVLAWVTGANGNFLQKDGFISSVTNGVVQLEGSNDQETVFDALNEIADK